MLTNTFFPCFLKEVVKTSSLAKDFEENTHTIKMTFDKKFVFCLLIFSVKGQVFFGGKGNEPSSSDSGNINLGISFSDNPSSDIFISGDIQNGNQDTSDVNIKDILGLSQEEDVFTRNRL